MRPPTGRPRRDSIDESTVGLYHIYCRCVRRAFLCGPDPVTGLDFRYRRDWIVDRMAFLAESYAIDACSYAVLSNHYHLILRNRPDVAKLWSEKEVAIRWWRLNAPEVKSDPDAQPLPAIVNAMLADEGRIETLRSRLASPSWFMQNLNYHIACRANREDNEDGHFFQERFGSVRLEDEAQVFAASVYVDLNEIRAGIATRPEDSYYTSACRRLWRLTQREQWMLDGDLERADRYSPDDPDYWLAPVCESATAPSIRDYTGTTTLVEQPESDTGPAGAAAGENVSESSPQASIEGADKTSRRDGVRRRRKSRPEALRARMRKGYLPITLQRYIELLDILGREISPGKKAGKIDDTMPPVMERLGVHFGERASSQLAEMQDRFRHLFPPAREHSEREPPDRTGPAGFG